MPSLCHEFERLDASSHEHLEAQLLRPDEAATKDVASAADDRPELGVHRVDLLEGVNRVSAGEHPGESLIGRVEHVDDEASSVDEQVKELRQRVEESADILADVCALLLYGGFDLGDEQSAWSRWRPILDALTSMSVEPVTVRQGRGPLLRRVALLRAASAGLDLSVEPRDAKARKRQRQGNESARQPSGEHLRKEQAIGFQGGVQSEHKQDDGTKVKQAANI